MTPNVFRAIVNRSTRTNSRSRSVSSRSVSPLTSDSSTGQGSSTQTPSYVERLTQLINQVTASSQALQARQQTLQEQALQMQQRAVVEANEQTNIDQARANDASRESYVTLLQQILLNT